MSRPPRLRDAGDFRNRRVVEYATILTEIPLAFVPSNLVYELSNGVPGMVRNLSVTPIGRLTWKRLYLDSEELAYSFREHLHRLFEGRSYADNYAMTVVVTSSTETEIVTMYKKRHSAAVRETLGQQREQSR